MGCRPCGDNCCGHSFQKATKVCAGIDIAMGAISFIITLIILLTLDKIADPQVYAKLIKAASKGSEENKPDTSGFPNYNRAYQTIQGFLIATVVACGLQVLLGIYLYWVADKKNKTGCTIWLVLTICQILVGILMNILVLLRVIEVLIVVSFISEITDEHEAATAPYPSEGNKRNGQIFPFGKSGKNPTQNEKDYPGQPQAFTSTYGSYPPPPKYELPNSQQQPYYNYNNGSKANGNSFVSANVQRNKY